MSKRKLLIIAMALSIVAILAVGGTLAYFTDTDADKNVMTVGKIDIDQIETFNPNEDKLLPDLYIQKEVNVQNIGNANAYIRTILAFENTPGQSGNGSDGIAALMWFDHDWTTGEFEWFAGTALDCLKIGDKYYSIGVQTYENAVEPNEYAGVSLKGVYLDKNVTQEQFENAGGNLDAPYEILVLSQAVQADTFTDAETALNTAFGEITPENAALVAEWLEEAASMTGITTTTQK